MSRLHQDRAFTARRNVRAAAQSPDACVRAHTSSRLHQQGGMTETMSARAEMSPTLQEADPCMSKYDKQHRDGTEPLEVITVS